MAECSVTLPSTMLRSPSIAVTLELLRALAGVALVPLRVVGYLMHKGRLDGEVAEDLAADPPPVAEPSTEAEAPRGRPLRIFISAAEHSGEIHAANLIDALRARAAALGEPAPEFHGLGGRALEERGMLSVGDPGARAAMGFDGVLKALPFYLKLLTRTTRHFVEWRPDVVLPVDSPALHVPLGRLAKKAGARVVHFVTPQYWGWAPWRVRSYTSAVDLGLSILPFEPRWYARHHVPTRHIGHPLLDELAALGVEERTAPPEEGPLVLLPGSRAGVVARNLPWMLDRVAELQARPEFADLEVILPHSRTDLDELFDELIAASPARVERVRGPLHEELARGRAAFVVSGTVVLDLLPHRLPSVVLYRLKSRLQGWMRDHLLSVPWFTSVNLLANEEVHPEFGFHGEGPKAEVTAALARALDDQAWRAKNLAGQERARRRLGPPGAVERAAAVVLEGTPVGGSAP